MEVQPQEQVVVEDHATVVLQQALGELVAEELEVYTQRQDQMGQLTQVAVAVEAPILLLVELEVLV
jgi:hypothetical protein